MIILLMLLGTIISIVGLFTGLMPIWAILIISMITLGLFLVLAKNDYTIVVQIGDFCIENFNDIYFLVNALLVAYCIVNY